MRELTAHRINECNQAIKITALDGPGPGGASHGYKLDLPLASPCNAHTYLIYFQNGAIKEVGTNGLTHEALLAILIDRLEGFQSGPYACVENQTALDHLRDAMEVLHDRTIKRDERGVEGTMQV